MPGILQTNINRLGEYFSIVGYAHNHLGQLRVELHLDRIGQFRRQGIAFAAVEQQQRKAGIQAVQAIELRQPMNHLVVADTRSRLKLTALEFEVPMEGVHSVADAGC